MLFGIYKFCAFRTLKKFRKWGTSSVDRKNLYKSYLTFVKPSNTFILLVREKLASYRTWCQVFQAAGENLHVLVERLEAILAPCQLSSSRCLTQSLPFRRQKPLVGISNGYLMTTGQFDAKTSTWWQPLQTWISTQSSYNQNTWFG